MSFGQNTPYSHVIVLFGKSEYMEKRTYCPYICTRPSLKINQGGKVTSIIRTLVLSPKSHFHNFGGGVGVQVK